MQNSDGIILNQSQCIQKLKTLLLSLRENVYAEEGNLEQRNRGLVGKLNWAVQGTKPDMAFEVVEMSSRFKVANLNDLVRANTSISKLKEKSYTVFQNLGNQTFWRIIVESDAGHTNMEDRCSSAGSQLIILTEEKNKCYAFARSSKKIKR